jgi:hypothetical protein
MYKNNDKMGVFYMKWEEARKIYPGKWLLFEAIDAHSEEGKRVVDEISIINAYDEGKTALKEYAEKHKKDKSREMYVYNTKNEKLFIEERIWIGVRKNG